MTGRLFDAPAPASPPPGATSKAQAVQAPQRPARPRKRASRTKGAPAPPLYTLRCAHGCGWTARRRGLARAIDGFGETMRCPGCHRAAAITITGVR